jgi:hypothetical protein
VFIAPLSIQIPRASVQFVGRRLRPPENLKQFRHAEGVTPSKCVACSGFLQHTHSDACLGSFRSKVARDLHFVAVGEQCHGQNGSRLAAPSGLPAPDPKARTSARTTTRVMS